MLNRKWRRPSPSMTVALIAMFFALAGTGIAASRYIITSTSQIKPSVLKELRGGPTATASAVTVKRYANRVTTGLNPPATTILEIPGIVKITTLKCTAEAANGRMENLGSGDLFDQATGSYVASWVSHETAEARPMIEVHYHITSGTGLSSIIAEITTNMSRPGSECVFVATAQVYKG